MSIYDDDWGDPEDRPRTVSRAEQEKNGMIKRTSYVPAQPERRTVAYPMPHQGDNTIIDLSDALRAQNLNETTDPVTRSLAFALRVGLLIALLGTLAYGLILVILTGDGLGWTLVVFSFLAVAGYYLLNKLDFEYSPSGVEKDKIQAIERVTLDKQRGERALRQVALDAYLKHLEGSDK